MLDGRYYPMGVFTPVYPKVAEILKIKNPEIRKNPEESHPWYFYF